MVIVGCVNTGVTVNVAVGEFVPSVAWTVWLPIADDGTVKVALNAPVGLVVIVAGEVVCAVPS